MATKTLEAIIISRRNFGEADRLITAFSRSEGKITIIARGSRKIKSRLAAHAEPFTIGKYFLVEGKSFYILAGAESENNYFNSDNDLELYKDVSFIFEIVDMVTVEGQPSQQIYDLICEVLKRFYKLSAQQRKVAIRYFEYKILQYSGYLGSYQNCKKCGKPLSESKKYFGGAEGFYCKDCEGKGGEIDLNTFKLMRLLETSTLDKILAVKDIDKYIQKIGAVTDTKLYDILPKIPRSKDL